MPTLNETFDVPDEDAAWTVVSDLNKLVPCVPGAKVTESDSPTSVKAEIDVKMGSMSMTFSGPVTIKEQDEGSKKAVIEAKTREAAGQSNAEGVITISVGGGSGTIETVADISGKAGSMGEGTIEAVLKQLIEQFTDNLVKA